MKVTERLIRNLTNEEKDRLNAWANLNDTESERAFFMHKFDVRTATLLLVMANFSASAATTNSAQCSTRSIWRNLQYPCGCLSKALPVPLSQRVRSEGNGRTEGYLISLKTIR